MNKGIAIEQGFILLLELYLDHSHFQLVLQPLPSLLTNSIMKIKGAKAKKIEINNNISQKIEINKSIDRDK